MIEAQSFLVLVQDALHLLLVLFVDGKGNVFGILPADGLENYVHVDVMLAQQVKDLEGDAGVVIQADQGDPGDAGVLGDAGDVGLFHFRNLLDFRAGLPLQAGKHFQIYSELLGQLHAAVVEHLGPLRRQLQHLVIGNFLQLPGRGNQAGVRGVHAVHVGVDLAEVRPERRRQGHGAGVGPAPAQGGHVPHPVDPLEAGHQNDLVLVQLPLDALGVDALDAGVGVDGGGLDARLPGRQGHAGQAHGLQGHGAEGNGNLLAGGKEHIQLPFGGAGVNLLRLFDQVVGGIPLGGQDHDHVVSLDVGLRDDPGDILDALRVPHGAAAEFLYNQTHMSVFLFRLKSGCRVGRGRTLSPALSYAGTALRVRPPAPACRPARSGNGTAGPRRPR